MIRQKHIFIEFAFRISPILDGNSSVLLGLKSFLVLKKQLRDLPRYLCLVFAQFWQQNRHPLGSCTFFNNVDNASVFTARLEACFENQFVLVSECQICLALLRSDVTQPVTNVFQTFLITQGCFMSHGNPSNQQHTLKTPQHSQKQSTLVTSQVLDSVLKDQPI